MTVRIGVFDPKPETIAVRDYDTDGKPRVVVEIEGISFHGDLSTMTEAFGLALSQLTKRSRPVPFSYDDEPTDLLVNEAWIKIYEVCTDGVTWLETPVHEDSQVARWLKATGPEIPHDDDHGNSWRWRWFKTRGEVR